MPAKPIFHGRKIGEKVLRDGNFLFPFIHYSADIEPARGSVLQSTRLGSTSCFTQSIHAPRQLGQLKLFKISPGDFVPFDAEQWINGKIESQLAGL